MKELLNVDLVSINCVNPEQSIKALLHSSKDIKFASIKILSHYKPTNLVEGIEFIEIPKQTHQTMNWFDLNEFPNYVQSEFVLNIHDDGFIINPHLWTDEFYEYDYIGAPWPALDWCKKNRVGNGGFNWRSKKFINLQQSIPKTQDHNDVVLTNTYYEFFKIYGCKYAPIEVAAQFSMEHEIPECKYDLEKCFGFHGKLTEQAKQKIKLLESYN